MTPRKILGISAAVSLILHAGFFVISDHISVSVTQMQDVYAAKNFQIRNIQINPVLRKEMVKAPLKKETLEGLKFQAPEIPQNTQNVKESVEDLVKKSAPELVQKKDFQKPVDQSQVDYNKVLDEAQKDFKKIKQKEAKETRADVFAMKALDDVDIELYIQPSEAHQDKAIFEKDFASDMPGFTPKILEDYTPQDKLEYPLLEEKKKTTSTIQRRKNFTDIKQYLICELTTYQDPSDGAKYFKIGVRAGEKSQDLKTIPKEIVFLIDSSLSIQEDRLNEFKKGLEYLLKQMPADNVFNIISFKEQTEFFKTKSVHPAPEKIQEALAFVETISAGASTDTFEALKQTIDISEAMNPSYLFFFSDGRPTSGEKDSTRIISEISSLNQGQKAIFAFNGGSRVNRYLLDFLSYKNRGWAEYAPRTHLIDDYLVNIYRKIQNPILLKLRYNLSGINNAEVFPKILPDFFRNAEFTLYGRYSDEDKVVFQLLGESDNEVKEFVVEGSLAEASIGDESIARNWAFNKIYDLISQLHDQKSVKNQEDLIAEINALSQKHGIQTPYSENLKRRWKF